MERYEILTYLKDRNFNHVIRKYRNHIKKFYTSGGHRFMNIYGTI